MADTYCRIGDESKCPACGWRLDAEAYRCPKCLIYFCYKCRKRIPKGENQFQCANQTCSCYGKLLCSACTVMMPVFRDVEEMLSGWEIKSPPEVKEPERVIREAKIVRPSKNGSKTFAFYAAVFCGIIAWWNFSFGGGVLTAIIAYIITLIAMAFAGYPLDDTPVTIEPRLVHRKVGEHRCCIQCKQPAEVVS